MRYHWLLLITCCCLFACQKEETPAQSPTDPVVLGIDDFTHFVFGSYAGRCGGDCSLLFRYIDGKVQADAVAQWVPGQALVFTDSLPGSVFGPVPSSVGGVGATSAVVELINELPDLLLRNAQSTYGCPDCYDQGGYYLELATKQNTRS